MSLNAGSGFTGVDAPSPADLSRCVHCGLCLSACPTYTTLGVETESPRGRIALMKAVQDGRVGITPRVVGHWEMCLQCRACEAVCPSGVPYGRMMAATRAQVRTQGRQSAMVKGAGRLLLRGALPHPRRLRLGAGLLRLYQRCGVQWLVRSSRVLRLLPGGLAQLEAALPALSRSFFGPSGETHRALGEKRLTVGLLSGCVMPLMQADTMRASVRVLILNGCDVVVPLGQGCCGALNQHSGDLEYARRMARRNIDVFLAAGVERIVTASAGCGASMKEYHELLQDDAEYAEKARRFSELTMDITELLVSLPFAAPTARLERRVTYQDPCHLAHAQRITAPPRAILQAIPGVELVEMEQASMCCGGAGIYSAVQPELSGQILERKLGFIAETGAEVVATANPGCMMQLEQGLRRKGSTARVCHVVDLLDEGYRGEE
ncbi:MAG: 4Fe-4S dicluster domain-containing protein [Dehalococcoidia bacterium]|nr:4Fe-4S dicluster domain-containing protein [Dehalococcoidia bacterium]MSQ17645.1 4Fe-4S dicluster domain-containing protein [Dehalococcoidia bacterium]